jgi:hypothetical protein
MTRANLIDGRFGIITGEPPRDVSGRPCDGATRVVAEEFAAVGGWIGRAEDGRIAFLFDLDDGRVLPVALSDEVFRDLITKAERC